MASVQARATVVARQVARGVARRVERVEMEVAVKSEGEILDAAVERPVAAVADLVAARAVQAVGEG